MDRAPLGVLIADDHPVFRQGLASFVEGCPGLELVAAVASGSEAVATAARLRPDVAVLDLRMPDMDGIEATRALISASPSTAVLILTAFEEDETVTAALRAGARGFLLKGADSDEIARAIAAVGDGDAIFGRGVAPSIIARATGQTRDGGAHPFPELTLRERDVLDLMARGRDNTSIARVLGVAEKTVRNYASSIFAKLAVGSRAEAVVLARQAGLGRETGDPG